jgi:bifunctional DNA-binding transcriptional regulator/antitoxin component of YhaV-PrlF toxin-antitoxin module
MGYVTKVQVIERANDTRQFYFICPAPLAQALGIEKGEAIEWLVEDRHTLMLRRTPPAKGAERKGTHGR